MNLMIEGEGGLQPCVVEQSALVRAVFGVKLPPKQRAKFAAPGEALWDPACAGWLLVVPDDDDGRAIAQALAPLVAHRLEPRDENSSKYWQTEADAVKFFPRAAAADAVALQDWFDANITFATGRKRPPPDYVLIAGPPSSIPFAVDFRLQARQQRVGRLYFPERAAYRAYAEKLVSWEPDDDFKVLGAGGSFRKNLPVCVFAPDWGPADATYHSRRFLADPFADFLSNPRQIGKNTTLPALPVKRLVAEDATRDELMAALRGDAAELAGPRLLFSASHGLAVPGGDKAIARRLQRQGAINCQDALIMGDAEILTADALGDGALLRGGIWVMFACFGGGTPQSSDFYQTLQAPDLLGLDDGGPFVAALPTRLLANPDGPLAIVAHLDPSFVSAISRPGGPQGQRATTIQTIGDWLLLGERVGGAMAQVAAFTNQSRDELESFRQAAREIVDVDASDAEVVAAVVDAEPGTERGKRLAELRDQILNSSVSLKDYRNFLILGDPAAKLPHAGAEPKGYAPRAFVTPDRGVAPPPAPPELVTQAFQENRLRFTCSDDIFSPAGVPLPAGERVVVALRAEPCADVRRKPAEKEDGDGNKKPFFEAIEHQDCAIAAKLRFSATEVHDAPVKRLALANGAQLLYGEIISLSGDFYGIPGTQVASGEEAFRKIFKTLDEGDTKELGRILSAMREERVAVDTALGEHQSVVDAYGRVVDDLNGKYNRATGGGSPLWAIVPPGRYLQLAAVNFDHFGGDAIAAYKAAHGVACAEAIQARGEATPEGKRCGLTRAYAMNACADHFLTDLFASGHLRVPRHELAEQIRIKIAGDLLSKRMHDEDNARGLKVRNANGDSWTTYGDKHFHIDENAKGREVAREAVRRSTDEVWRAFDTGAAPAFSALQMTPDLADALQNRDNASPLFIVDGERRLLVRERLDDPKCFKWTADFTGVGTLLRGAVDPLVGKHTH